MESAGMQPVLAVESYDIELKQLSCQQFEVAEEGMVSELCSIVQGCAYVE